MNLEYMGPGPSNFLKVVLKQKYGLGFSTAALISVTVISVCTVS